MGANETPNRPWWRKSRWASAAVLLLVAAYPASAGPAFYAVLRGWVAAAYYDAAFAPLDRLMPNDVAGTPTPFSRYLMWWGDAARRHAESD